MVVEPPLLSHLEDRISAMCKAGARQMDSSSGAVACESGSPPVQAPESVNCPQDHPFDGALFLH